MGSYCEIYHVVMTASVALAGISYRAEACNPLLNSDFGRHVAPSVLPADMRAKSHSGSRAASDNLNCTGRPVFCGTTVALVRTRLPLTMSPI